MSGKGFDNRGGGRGSGRGTRDDGRGSGQFTVPHHGHGVGSRGRGSFRGDGSEVRGRGRGRGRGAFSDTPIFTQSITVQPDLSISRDENNIVRLTRDPGFAEGAAFPRRPGFGSQGRSIVLWTNHLMLKFDPDLLLYRYSVKISSAEGKQSPTGKKAKRIIQLFLTDHFGSQKDGIASDFKSNLISKTELSISQADYAVQYRAEDEDEPQTNTAPYRVRIAHTGALTVSELTSEAVSTNLDELFASKEEISQALNIVIGHHAKSDPAIASIGSSRHYSLTSADKISLAGGLQILRGFFCAVRAATSRVLLNVQVRHGAFFEACRLDVLASHFNAANSGNLEALAAFLRNVSIDVTHIVRKNKKGEVIKRIKKVVGFATVADGRDGQNPPKVASFGAGSKDVQFFMPEQLISPKGPAARKSKKKAQTPGPSLRIDGRYVSVYDYFKEAYQIAIGNAALPVINTGTVKNPVYLPMEVCNVLPGQPATSQPLSASQLQQTIKFAARRPLPNAQSIVTTGLQTLGLPSNATLGSFGIEVDTNLIAVPGRILAPPAVKYRGGKSAEQRFGSWNLRSLQLARPVSLTRWTYLNIVNNGTRAPWADIKELQSIVESFRETLKTLGINAGPCAKGLDIDFHSVAQIDEQIHRFAKSNNPPELLLVFLPSTDNARIYRHVKFVCDIKFGLINVCVVASKFAKRDAQYFANVGLKVNLKLKGQNHYVDGSQLGNIGEGKTMVVGLDVTHPSPGSSNAAPSVAGIVASVDKNLAQWPAELLIQTGRQEMVSGLDGLIKSRLALWKEHNGSYPQNILFCRDGVSEGEYKRVLDQEEPQLREAFRDVYSLDDTKSGLPRLTFVIAGKRHNARFYPTRQQDADRFGNPMNGTVVDRGVTQAGMWECYLQSHTAIQGTARPAHYTIVLDEIFARQRVVAPFQNTADIAEGLLHTLCYLHGRATKAVSLCTPAQYAHLVCERARQYLSDVYSGHADGASIDPKAVQIHANVRHSMFYI